MTYSFKSASEMWDFCLSEARKAKYDDKCPAIVRQERIDFLKRLSKNAYALRLGRAYRNIMVALGGRMLERDFGRPYQREIVD